MDYNFRFFPAIPNLGTFGNNWKESLLSKFMSNPPTASFARNVDRFPFFSIRFFIRIAIHSGLGASNSIQRRRTNRRGTEKWMFMQRSLLDFTTAESRRKSL